MFNNELIYVICCLISWVKWVNVLLSVDIVLFCVEWMEDKFLLYINRELVILFFVIIIFLWDVDRFFVILIEVFLIGMMVVFNDIVYILMSVKDNIVMVMIGWVKKYIV